uniref:Uncharacterized protein n=1 Tax=Glossina pallidipes TaxID=7398 RepID=A0A1A9ZGQ7_GLOPL
MSSTPLLCTFAFEFYISANLGGTNYALIDIKDEQIPQIVDLTTYVIGCRLSFIVHRGADHVSSAIEVALKDRPTEDALRCQAQVHRSQVVSPSAATLSSRNGGRGGGGTKRPFHRPFSLASKANGDSNVSSSMAFDHQSSSAAGNKFLIDVAFVPTSLMGAVASKSAVIEGSYGDNS